MYGMYYKVLLRKVFLSDNCSKEYTTKRASPREHLRTSAQGLMQAGFCLRFGGFLVFWRGELFVVVWDFFLFGLV